jgi:hypothetical protein
MKSEISKGALLAIVGVLAVVLLIGGFLFARKASGPEVATGRPPAGFYERPK